MREILNTLTGLMFRMARLTALQLYRYLPAKNCGRCDEATCMAFAIRLIERTKKAADCPELTDEGLRKLIDFITPPVRDVEFGAGENKIIVGGEEVTYRHELKFYNPTPFFIDVSDLMDDEEIMGRVEFAQKFEVERIGKILRLQGVSIRCASNDPGRFRETVKKVAGVFPGALILCSFNPEVLRAGIEVVKRRKPLLYAANKGNWEDVLKIAQEYGTAMAVYSSNLDELGSLTKQISSRNFNDIILDPAAELAGSGLARTLNKLVMLRKSAVNGVKELGYPLMCSTVAAWMDFGEGRGNPQETENPGGELADEEIIEELLRERMGGGNPGKNLGKSDAERIEAAYHESTAAGMLLDRFVSLMILHSIDVWAILPLVTLRQNIYTDPRVEPSVESKLYEIGSPDESSPVFITTNFALTYFNVSGDLESAKISCYLLVIDTEGLAATVSVAAEKITASGVKEALDECSIENRVKHHRLIIPGVAARLKGEFEDATGWEIMVGPQDSSQIPEFLRENW